MHENFNELIVAFPHCCQKNKVVSEKGKRMEVASNEDFTKIRIDGCLIASEEIQKCDYGFARHDAEEFYFVELKGKDIETAFNQITSAIVFFQENLIQIPKVKRFGFIISSSGVPNARQRIYNLKQRFARDYGNHLEIKGIKYLHTPK